MVNRTRPVMDPEFDQEKEELVLELFDCGAIQLAPWYKPGFKFKFHQRYPRAPRPPMKFHLRTPEVTTYGVGPLTEPVLNKLALLLWRELRWLVEVSPQLKFMAGIPNAGVSIAKAVQRLASDSGLVLELVNMRKVGQGNERQIDKVAPPPYRHANLVLLDDVISHGGSKAEAFSESEEAGWLVEALLVLIDWQLGGREAMERRGLRVVVVMNVQQVIDTLRCHGRISVFQRWRVIRYIRLDQRFRARLKITA